MLIWPRYSVVRKSVRKKCVRGTHFPVLPDDVSRIKCPVGQDYLVGKFRTDWLRISACR